MWDVIDRTCAPGGFWLESHQRLVAAARSIDWVVRMGCSFLQVGGLWSSSSSRARARETVAERRVSSTSVWGERSGDASSDPSAFAQGGPSVQLGYGNGPLLAAAERYGRASGGGSAPSTRRRLRRAASFRAIVSRT
jgi:hypothetical protein